MTSQETHRQNHAKPTTNACESANNDGERTQTHWLSETEPVPAVIVFDGQPVPAFHSSWAGENTQE
jgi:hypothetical protein